MLSVQQLQEFISSPDFDKKEKWQDDILKRRGVYFGMSLHMDGACPYWWSLREPHLPWIKANLIRKNPLTGWMGMEYHWIFELQLFNRYPTEQDIIRNWRYSNYKPKQKAYFDNCVQMLQGAIFQDSGYSITMSDEADDAFIWGENFTVSPINGTKTNFANFFSLNIKNICADPNGFFVIVPKEKEQIEPDIWFVRSENLRFISKDEIIFWRDGYVWVVNKVGYFRWKKNGEEWKLVDPQGYYAHMLGYIPAIVAGGVLNTDYYESWLQAAKPIADDFVIAMSDEAMCAKQASFPFISEIARDCPDCQKSGQVMICKSCSSQDCNCEDESNERWESRVCNTCKGSGNLAIEPGERLSVPKQDMALEHVKIVNIPVDANKMHAERVEALKMDLQKSLHLNYIDQAQSGEAKKMDMEPKFNFFTTITNDIFDRLIPFCLDTILSLKKVSVTPAGVIPYQSRGNKYDYTIIKPTQFQVKTSWVF